MPNYRKPIIIHPSKFINCSERNKDQLLLRMATPSSQLVKLSSSLALFFFVLAFLCAVSATDHIVGANRGWNPGINYTLWANNQTFYVGDLISFRYVKNQYNVFEVNQTGYGNCTTEGAIGNWTKGKDFIPLNEAKRYYFIGGNGQCFNGMKVSVLVHPLPPPPSSAVAAKHENPSSAAAAPMLLSGGFWFSMLMSSSALVWFGCGWI